MFELMMLLAQTTAPTTGPAPTGGGNPMFQMLGIFVLIGVFMWVMSRGRNKERKRFEEMLAAIKKGDRVQSIGGIYGTVVDVRENEIVVKVDESSNTKLRLNRAAIKEVIQEQAPETK